MERQFTVIAKGQTIAFTSALTDIEAHSACRDISGDFAQSLFGKQLNHLSPKQIAWCHKLALGANKAPAPIDTELNIHAAVVSLTHAAQFVKYPKFQLPINGSTNLKMFLCGPKSEYHGQVGLTIQGTWVGRIEQTGRVLLIKTLSEEAMNLLKNLAFNFAETIKSLGKMYGHCMFCGRSLTDARSQAVGAGAICCNHYGIDYPTLEEANNADVFALPAPIDGTLQIYTYEV